MVPNTYEYPTNHAIAIIHCIFSPSFELRQLDLKNSKHLVLITANQLSVTQLKKESLEDCFQYLYLIYSLKYATEVKLGPWPEKQRNWLGHPAASTLTNAVYFDLLTYWN